MRVRDILYNAFYANYKINIYKNRTLILTIPPHKFPFHPPEIGNLIIEDLYLDKNIIHITTN